MCSHQPAVSRTPWMEEGLPPKPEGREPAGPPPGVLGGSLQRCLA